MSRRAPGFGADIQDEAAFAMTGHVDVSYELDLRQIIKTGKEPRQWAAAALGLHPAQLRTGWSLFILSEAAAMLHVKKLYSFRILRRVRQRGTFQGENPASPR